MIVPFGFLIHYPFVCLTLTLEEISSPHGKLPPFLIRFVNYDWYGLLDELNPVILPGTKKWLTLGKNGTRENILHPCLLTLILDGLTDPDDFHRALP